jgi:hypothetical protein
MRVDFDTSTSLVIQQTVTGSATFDGSSAGRAFLTLGSGTSAVTFRARKLGTDFNGYKVAMIAPPQDNPSERVSFDANDNRLDIVLRKVSGSVTSTAAQVAAAVQAAGCIVTAAYGSTGAGTIVPATGVLASGIDPTVVRNTQYKFAPTGNGGGFNFYQSGNVLLRQFEAKLTASTAWTLSIINLDEGLSEIAGETVQIAGATDTDVFLTNINVVVSPLRALKFVTATQGVARVIGHKEPNFPLV